MRISLPVLLAALLLLPCSKDVAAQTATYSGGSIYDLKPPMRQSTGNRHLEALILSKRQHRMKEIREYPARTLYRRLARPVGRLAMQVQTRNGNAVAYCTVSLIDESLILTNHHCIPGNPEGKVTDALLWMGFIDSRHNRGVRQYGVELKPVEASKTLDYAIHKVRGKPGKAWGTIEFAKKSTLYGGQPLFVIHHPAGDKQHISLGNCQAGQPATENNDLFHVCDTIGGSSGAPVFDSESRKVVGLHYSAVDVGSLNAAKRMDRLIKSSPVLQRLAIGIFRDPVQPPSRQRKSYEPETVFIPGGTFSMGCVSGKDCSSDEKPVHRVTVSGFHMSKYETTFTQWDVCVASGGCNSYKPPDEGWGRGRRPVIHVSWHDAKTYVDWLSRKTGRKYRLPSEVEWEYAVRAGSQTRYFFGNDDKELCAYVNGADKSASSIKDRNMTCNDGFGNRTATAGSYKPNAFGLHDMAGNVWEWVEDCWRGDYHNAPADGSARRAANCTKHVIRGGSWGVIPRGLRSAFRAGVKTDYRDDDVGFRVVRDLKE